MRMFAFFVCVCVCWFMARRLSETSEDVKSASERSRAPLSVTNERDSHTTRVCQATLWPGLVLAGP